LEELISKLNTILTNKGISLSPDSIITHAETSSNFTDPNKDTLVSSCCKLLLNASITLDRLSGIIRL